MELKKKSIDWFSGSGGAKKRRVRGLADADCSRRVIFGRSVQQRVGNATAAAGIMGWDLFEMTPSILGAEEVLLHLSRDQCRAVNQGGGLPTSRRGSPKSREKRLAMCDAIVSDEPDKMKSEKVCCGGLWLGGKMDGGGRKRERGVWETKRRERRRNV